MTEEDPHSIRGNPRRQSFNENCPINYPNPIVPKNLGVKDETPEVPLKELFMIRILNYVGNGSKEAGAKWELSPWKKLSGTCSRQNVLKSLDPKVTQGAKAGTIPSSTEMLFSEDITHVQRPNHAG